MIDAFHFKNGPRGFSIVELLVGVGIMMVLMVAMMSLQSSQQKENQALTEKLASLDVSRAITSTITTAACSTMFAPNNLIDPSKIKFNPAGITVNNPHIIGVSVIPNGGTGPAIAESGKFPSALSSSLQILPQTALPNPGIRVLVSSPTSATLVVSFDQTKLVRPIHDLSFTLNLQSTSDPTGTTITGCQGVTPLTADAGTICGSRQGTCMIGGTGAVAVAAYDGNYYPTPIAGDLLPPNIPCQGNTLTLTCTMQMIVPRATATGVQGCPPGYTARLNWGALGLDDFGDPSTTPGPGLRIYNLFCVKN